jgi:uncharacterized protein (TIGR02246 family)
MRLTIAATALVLGATITAFMWLESAVSVFGAQRTAQRSADEAAVREVVRSLERLFNQGDADGLGQLYVEDGDRRDAAGRSAKGRRAVRDEYETAFRNRQPRRAAEGNQTRWDEGEVRFLRADVAVVDGFYTLPDRRRGPYTLVITREGGRWLIAAARAGTAVQPAG